MEKENLLCSLGQSEAPSLKRIKDMMKGEVAGVHLGKSKSLFYLSLNESAHNKYFIKIARFLISFGLDINYKEEGQNVLHLLCKHYKKETIHLGTFA